jgi:hypothetical protein
LSTISLYDVDGFSFKILIKIGANAVTGDVPRGLYSALGRSHRVSRTAY